MDRVSSSNIPSSQKYRIILICLFLISVTLFVYWPVQDYDFVNFDDSIYVYENRYVQEGLTLRSILWAFSFSKKEGTYWHPLAWLSHMLDCQLYGLNPGKHHLTNLFFHIANSLLLFLIFKLMTGNIWRSAFIATLFAIHPINVDSVAWITERKNVLSTFFGMLTLLSYIYYAEKPLLFRYLFTLFVFVLGLMTKPMLATLPCVFLLLDYWPLERFSHGPLYNDRNKFTSKTLALEYQKLSPFFLFLEKIPLLILSVLSIYLSSLSVENYGPRIFTPIKLRIENALVSYVKYIGKMIWPLDLAVLYPYPRIVPLWQAMGALLLLCLTSTLVIRLIKKAPYFAVGWAWYLGTLVPVLGLVQVGLWPAMADRFAYVPLIGMFIIIAWGVPETVTGRLRNKIWLSALSIAIFSAMVILTQQQIQYWKNSISLFTRALEVTSNNDTAHNNLGLALDEKGQTDAAIEHYRKALNINTHYWRAYYNLGNALRNNGQTDAAIEHYWKALCIKKNHAKAHNNLGVALREKGQTDAAIEHYQEALNIKPDYAEAHNNLGIALRGKGQTNAAIEHYKKALNIKKDLAETHYNLGNVLFEIGQTDAAIEHFLKALNIRQNHAETHNSLAIALFNKGQTDAAIEHYKKALNIKKNYVEAYNNLAMALFNKDQTDAAIEHYKKALSIKPDYAEAHYNLGNALLGKGQTDAAIEHYRKALSIKPDYTRAHNNLAIAFYRKGNALLEKGQTDAAIEHYKKGLSIKPDYAKALNNMAIALYHKGNVEMAVRYFKTAIEINPKYVDAKNNLKKVLMLQKKNQ
jgi:protein O-mannosyl-transferase